jgi:hypothetical protein
MTKTPKRRTPRASARKLPLPTPYTHADGRPGYLVATSNGPPLSMPAFYWETVKRHGVPNAFRWNGDHKNKEQHGEKGIAYVRVCCKEPGRRGKNNKPSTRTEPLRDCRRLQLLRKWSHDNQTEKQVFT